ncbi:MAG: thiamine phosphate synthase, partial [Alphaproteobacteria bacterium]|nr:thiamine phosphate synthase [Alphaproteobacteria bacterium]
EADIIKAAETLLPLCRAHNINLIMNDNPALARLCDCDGVHIGQSDMPYTQARQIMGADKIIGVTCHASHHLAIQAAQAGADYVAFGAFYNSPTKTTASAADPSILKTWQAATTTLRSIPCVAIGGITPTNAAPLIAAGADFLAVSSGVWDYKDGAQAAIASFTALLNSAMERTL